MTEKLLDIFCAHEGIVSCVGAGGKKTTMFRLANIHPGRTGITATAHIEYFPRSLSATKYIGEEPELLESISRDTSSRCIAFAQPSQRRGRRAGIDINSVQKFHVAGKFTALFIKADGARSRYIKSPAGHEPPIPPGTSVVIPVVSIKAIGKKLTDKIAHRVDRVCEVAGMKPGEKILPIHMARIISSKDGYLKNTNGAKVIPLINMVDDEKLYENAVEVAQKALEMTNQIKQIVLASMRDEQPIKKVFYK